MATTGHRLRLDTNVIIGRVMFSEGQINTPCTSNCWV